MDDVKNKSSNNTKYASQLDVALKAARLAGDIIVQKRNNTTVSIKTNAADLVTEVDQKVEKVIVQFIKRHFPNDYIIGEEDYSTQMQTQTQAQAQAQAQKEKGEKQLIPSDQNVWCIDPIDGTTNFIHKYPFVNVSIGYCAAVKSDSPSTTPCQPTVGVIFNPILNEMYHAELNEGAYCNGTRIFVDTTANSLSNCLLVNNIGATRNSEFIEESTSRIAKWLHAGLRGFRAAGSACQNMSHVASGKVSSYYEHLYGGPWDVCAGMVLVKEAGGVVIDAVTGQDFVLYYGKGSICCGNDSVVKDVLRVAGVPLSKK